MNDVAETPVRAKDPVVEQDSRLPPGPGPRGPRARKVGRRPKLSGEQQAAIVDAVRSGQHTAAQMARQYKVSEPTLSRILAASRATGEAPVAEAPGGARILGVLPVAALDQRLAVVGTSGSGKTYATKGLVERLLQAGARVCVVDPLGVWWGLRLAGDGTSQASSPVVVFGGRHADIPLTSGMGTVLGRLVGTQALACVVDVSDLGSASGVAMITGADEAIAAHQRVAEAQWREALKGAVAAARVRQIIGSNRADAA